MIKTEFLRDIEAFLAASGMAPTAFGKATMRDASFVSRMRDPKSNVTVKTIDHVRGWMEKNKNLTTKVSA